MTPEREAEIRAEHNEPRDGRCDACDLLAVLDAERKMHDAESRELIRLGMSHIERAERAESSLADVRQRCGGYPDSRVDGDGGIVAVIVRERDKAQARAERAEARCAALGTDPSVPMERPSVLATMAERLGVAESERDEAQAALVVLREACRKGFV